MTGESSRTSGARHSCGTRSRRDVHRSGEHLLAADSVASLVVDEAGGHPGRGDETGNTRQIA